jgi:hypothetical protein
MCEDDVFGVLDTATQAAKSAGYFKLNRKETIHGKTDCL